MEVETIDAGHDLLLDFSHDGGRSARDQLGLDAEALLDTSLDVLSQLGAGGNGDDNLPSFLAASTILFHSFCVGWPVCACATVLLKIEPVMKTRRNNSFMRHPKRSLFPQKLPRHGSSGLSYLINLFFRLVF